MIHTMRGNGHFPLRFSSIFYREVESLKGTVLLGVLVAFLGKSIGFIWRIMAFKLASMDSVELSQPTVG